MAKQLTNDEQNLRRKARRRLIGAIALTLVVVVLLPMVLDREPKPTGQDIELRIPAPDKVGEFVPGVAVSEVPGISPFAASAVEQTPEVAASEVAASAVVPSSQPAAVGDSKTGAQAKALPTDNEKPKAKGQDQAEDGERFVAQVNAYINPDAAKKEADQLKRWGFNKVYTEKAGDMVRVRVGPYVEREKAEKVRQLLENHGLHPVVTSAK